MLSSDCCSVLTLGGAELAVVEVGVSCCISVGAEDTLVIGGAMEDGLSADFVLLASSILILSLQE